MKERETDRLKRERQIERQRKQEGERLPVSLPETGDSRFVYSRIGRKREMQPGHSFIHVFMIFIARFLYRRKACENIVLYVTPYVYVYVRIVKDTA